jgi:DNA-binding XRE family transcriptional regulator
MPRKKNGQDTAPRRVIHYKPGFERPKRGRRHASPAGTLVGETIGKADGAKFQRDIDGSGGGDYVQPAPAEANEPGSTAISRQRVKNRVAFFRQKTGLSQTGLALRVNTSQQQISRIEKGQDTSPRLAVNIAAALGQTLETIFPDLKNLKQVIEVGGDSRDVFKRAGIVEQRGWPTSVLRFDMYMGDMKSTIRSFVYHADEEEIQRTRADILNKEADDNSFLAFSSVGRSIYINVKHLLRMYHLGEMDALWGENRFNHLKCGYDNVNIWMRGETDVWSMPSEELDLEEFEQLMFLRDTHGYSRYIEFNDNDGESVVVNVDNMAVVEIPSAELLEEFDKLYVSMTDEKPREFLDFGYSRHPYRGKKLSKTDRATIYEETISALAPIITEHAAWLEKNRNWDYDVPDVLKSVRNGFKGVLKTLRQHGFSITPGSPEKALVLRDDGYYEPLYHALRDAYVRANARAAQHGEDTGRGAITGDMLRVLIIDGLASLRGAGYTIMPGNMFIAPNPPNTAGE